MLDKWEHPSCQRLFFLVSYKLLQSVREGRWTHGLLLETSPSHEMEAVFLLFGRRASRWQECRPSPLWLGRAFLGTWRDLARSFSGAERTEGS